MNQLRVLSIALVSHNKCTGKRPARLHTHTHTHQLEWKLGPSVKAEDNILKQRVCFEIRRGPRLYFRHRGDRREQESEGEQKHAHTLLTPSVKEIQEAFKGRFEETLMSQ